MSNKKIQIVLFISAIVLIILSLFIVFSEKSKTETKKIGFVMYGAKTEEGWNGMHYQGITKACEELGAELVIKENVKEEKAECATAVKELIEVDKVSMIILSSYSYPDEVKNIVDLYSDVAFYGISSKYESENMTSFFGRMYQARYLTGIIAGMKTENNVIGYVAAVKNCEVIRGINAFTLGVKKVNPNAKVVVMWTGDWCDKEKEKESANILINDKKVDVLTYHQNQPYVIEAAEEAGIYSIGYHESVEDVSDKYLTAAVWNWELLYKEIVKEYLQGNPNVKNRYWFGLETGAIGLSEYSPLVSEEIKNEVERSKNEILIGKEVFSGIIYDNEGNKRCDKNEVISDETLLEQMDWFVEGVEFYG